MRWFVVAWAMVLLAASCTSDGGEGDDGASPSSQAPSPAATAPITATSEGEPLATPPELVSADGTLSATLTLEQTLVDVAGESVTALAVNESWTMPTLRFAPGDTVELDLVNDTDQRVNLHFHGLHVSPKGESDNVFRVVEPGTTAHYRLDIPADHEPGTFWYHSHMHGISDEQVYRGMSGIMIVDGLAELLPEVLADVEQRVFAFKQVGFAEGSDGMEIPAAAPKRQHLVVNGQLRPEVSIREGETQLWRLANISADTWFDVKLRGHTLHVIAEDAWPVAEVWPADSLVLPPGKRFDVLVQGGDTGVTELITRTYDQGFQVFPEETLAMVAVSGGGDPAPIPEQMAPFEDLEGAEIAQERSFDFTIQPKPLEFLINGKAYNHHRIDATPTLGTVEEWTLTNNSTEQHPFHIHVNDFQVMSVDGKPYDAKGRQDTVVLPIGGEVVIRIPFEDFDGKFVFHCHILFHEDHGMMAIVDVEAA
ncbi:MAG: multicopper oxidase family protein [Actinomycetota bacterium]